MLLVVDKCSRVGTEIRRIADLVFVDTEVVMQEDADFALFVKKVRNADTSEEDVVVTRDRIVAIDPQPELCVLKLDVCH